MDKKIWTGLDVDNIDIDTRKHGAYKNKPCLHYKNYSYVRRAALHSRVDWRKNKWEDPQEHKIQANKIGRQA